MQGNEGRHLGGTDYVSAVAGAAWFRVDAIYSSAHVLC